MNTAPLPASLSPKQLQALAALASGDSVSHAAELAEVHRCTIYEWCRHHREFRAALHEARHLHAETLRDQLHQLASSAVSTIQAILEDAKAAPGTRLKAALSVIRAVEAGDPVNRRVGAATMTFEEYQSCYEDGYRKAVDDRSLAATLEPTPIPTPPSPVIARNEPCPCGSGKKYKRCCGTDAPPLLGPNTTRHDPTVCTAGGSACAAPLEGRQPEIGRRA